MLTFSTAVSLFLGLVAEDRPQWMQRWRGHETEVLDRAKWSKHEVVPRERLSQIAVRYGVQAESIMKWNELSNRRLKRGSTLKIKTRVIPVPREKLTYAVREGDTWGSIAADFRVDTKDLHAFNYKVRELEVGQILVLWFDPAVSWTVGRTLGPLPNHVLVRDDAYSVGRPQKGRIVNAVQLPESPNYTRRSERILWGSSFCIQALQKAFGRFRYETGFEGEVVIGSISLQHGRRFKPHKSHQSGRDVDIRLPLLPTVPLWKKPDSDQIDWLATWSLVEALVDTGTVHAVYLESGLQRPLYEAARALGRTHEELAPYITYPREKGKGRAYVRHVKGHDRHIHVRFRCGPDEHQCKDR